jgi:hypothetical protein
MGSGSGQSVALFGLIEEFREAYSLFILHVWYLSIDIHYIVLHVEFEDGLSIPVLKSKATPQNSSFNVLKRHSYTPPIVNSGVRNNRSRLDTRCMSECPR